MLFPYLSIEVLVQGLEGIAVKLVAVSVQCPFLYLYFWVFELVACQVNFKVADLIPIVGYRANSAPFYLTAI